MIPCWNLRHGRLVVGLEKIGSVPEVPSSPPEFLLYASIASSRRLGCPHDDPRQVVFVLASCPDSAALFPSSRKPVFYKCICSTSCCSGRNVSHSFFFLHLMASPDSATRFLVLKNGDYLSWAPSPFSVALHSPVELHLLHSFNCQLQRGHLS